MHSDVDTQGNKARSALVHKAVNVLRLKQSFDCGYDCNTLVLGRSWSENQYKHTCGRLEAELYGYADSIDTRWSLCCIPGAYAETCNSAATRSKRCKECMP